MRLNTRTVLPGHDEGVEDQFLLELRVERALHRQLGAGQFPSLFFPMQLRLTRLCLFRRLYTEITRK